MNTLELVKKMETTGKKYYSFADLKKLTGLASASLRVRLSRLVKSGSLRRLSRASYALFNSNPSIEKPANEAVYPSYFSFEYALSRLGYLSEAPYTVELAITRKTRKRIIEGTAVIYRKLKKELFFGYSLIDGMYFAEPEKAFLDSLYFKLIGKDSGFKPEKAYMDKFDRKKLVKYAKAYPVKVYKAVLALLPRMEVA
jgi:predicted transcriptional regulator of viral defense system